nr:hypothetical protein [uncultured Desulfuromonas sp.]
MFLKHFTAQISLWLLFLLALSWHHAAAQDTPPSCMPLTIDFAEFGASPDDTMQCIRSTTFNDQNNRTTDYSSYTRRDETLQFHDLTISQPVYDFCDDELFRIRFHIAVETQEPEEALDRVSEILEDLYQMTFIQEESQSTSQQYTAYKWLFKSTEDIVAEITWKRYGSCWDMPMVKVQKRALINKLNSAMNPNYNEKVY